MTMACAQSYCTEAARAAALASHSAASLAAAAGFREAARLLRSSEALARAATAALLALPRPEARNPGSGNGAEDGDVKVKKKRSNKKKKDMKAAMEGVIVGPELLPPAVASLRLRRHQLLPRPCPLVPWSFFQAGRRASWFPGPPGSALRMAPARQLQLHPLLRHHMSQHRLLQVPPLSLRVRQCCLRILSLVQIWSARAAL